MSEKPGEQAEIEVARRRTLALGIIGVFGGSALLEACSTQDEAPRESLEPELDRAMQALSGAGTVKYADTIADLRGLVSGAGDWIAIVKGYYTASDGGGGLFYWSATAAQDNGGTILNVSSGNSAGWRRIYAGPISVKCFGAKGDGTTNDTAAIQAAINFADAQPTKARVISFPAGTYAIASSGVTLRSGVSLISDDRATITQTSGTNITAFFRDPGTALSDVSFRGLVFDGNKSANATSHYFFYFSTGGHQRIRFVDSEVRNSHYGIGIIATSTTHDTIEIERCTFRNVSNAISASRVRRLSVSSSVFEDCASYGIVIPHAAAASNTCYGVTIIGNQFRSTAATKAIYFLHMANPGDVAAEDVVIEGNTLIGAGLKYADGGTADQISLQQVRRAAVNGNVSREGGDLGIIVDDSWNIVIADNVVDRCHGPGIRSHGCSDLVISGNLVTNNCQRNLPDATMGIYAGGTRVTITGNHCYDSTSPATAIKQIWGLYLLDGSLVTVGTNYFVYVAGSGLGGDIYVGANVTFQSYKTLGVEETHGGHIVSAIPNGSNAAQSLTTAVTAAAGVGATCTASGNDTAGTVTLTTGTGALGGGNLCTVTFLSSYWAAAKVMLTPRNPAAAGASYYINPAGASFSVASAGGFAASTAYVWDYIVLQ